MSLDLSDHAWMSRLAPVGRHRAVCEDAAVTIAGAGDAYLRTSWRLTATGHGLETFDRVELGGEGGDPSRIAPGRRLLVSLCEACGIDPCGFDTFDDLAAELVGKETDLLLVRGNAKGVQVTKIARALKARDEAGRS
jgi:hypothetical protein